MKLTKYLYNVKKEFINFRKLNHEILHNIDLIYVFFNDKFNILSENTIRVRLKNKNLKFYIRKNYKIDLGTLRSTFINQFQSIPEIENKTPEIIVDLGSNIGSTLVYYALKYPTAKIFGFEMDLNNFNLAKKNIVNYENIKLENCAIWYKNELVRYDNSIREDGFSATTNMLDGQIEVIGKTIGQLMIENNLTRIHYLKMDIEGAEKEIFFKGDLNWLASVELMNVELHDFNENEYEMLEKLLISEGFKVQKHWSHFASIYASR
jgi:FkbM family methyltransferase